MKPVPAIVRSTGARLPGFEQAPVDRASLLQALSTGEKKALYVLNILFEIEARKKGHTVSEQTLPDGSIKLTIQVAGGAA